MELPLKFEDIVDMYYDKMRPPKTHGQSKDLWNQSKIKENILNMYHKYFSLGQERTKISKLAKIYIYYKPNIQRFKDYL